LQLHIHLSVAFVTDEAVHVVHKLVVGNVAIAVFHHQFPHIQFTFLFALHVQLVVHQFNQAQFHVHGQLQLTELAVQVEHKFPVGFVSKLPQFALQQAQFIKGVGEVSQVFHVYQSVQTNPQLVAHLVQS
jgi:hypothetical protein